MRFRLAKLSDINEIVTLHYNVRDTYSVGFFSQMKKSFLKQYYKILLNDPNEVILCAVDDSDIICGFVSANLDVEEQFSNLRKHKISLAIAAVPSFLLNPRLIVEVWKRYQSTDKKSKKKFVTATGARGEYWVWNPENKESIWSTFLNNKHLEILYVLGVNNLSFEVDSVNNKVLVFSKMNGAVEVDKITLEDGRERILMNYDLNLKFSRSRKNRNNK